ncbi:MAG: DUF4381 domain-containing protein [Draconibacterium sp.]
MNETGVNTSALGQLIEPDPVHYSFNTPGWHAVLILLLLVILLIAFFQYRLYRKNAYRREALRQLEQIESSGKSLVFSINLLLKTMSIQLFGRRTVADLHSASWFSFLSSKLDKQPTLNTQSVEDFTLALYNEQFELEENRRKELLAFARLWIQKHKTHV